jgi:hypothetical protein
MLQPRFETDKSQIQIRHKITLQIYLGAGIRVGKNKNLNVGNKKCSTH